MARQPTIGAPMHQRTQVEILGADVPPMPEQEAACLADVRPSSERYPLERRDVEGAS